MSRAAIPAYLLARLFVPRRDAVVVALLTVLVPSMAYTGVVMTENAFYPAFLWTMFLIARAIRRPTVASQLLALARHRRPLRDAHPGRGPRRGARRRGSCSTSSPGRARSAARTWCASLPTLVAVGAVLVAAVAALVARGPNGVAGEQVGDVRRPAARRGAGVVRVPPRRARPLRRADPRGCVRRRDRPRHPSACARARAALRARSRFRPWSSCRSMVAVVSASIDVDGRETLNERYVFYLVPLLFLGLAIWIRAGLPRPRLLAAVARRQCAALALLVPIERLEYNAGFQSPSLLPVAGARPTRGSRSRSRSGHSWRSRPGLWLEVPDRARAAPLARGGRLDDARRRRSRSATTPICRRCPRGRSPAGPRTGSTVPCPPGERSPSSGARSRGARSPRASRYWLMVARDVQPERRADVYPDRARRPTTRTSCRRSRVDVRADSGRLERADGSPLERGTCSSRCRCARRRRVVATSPYGALQLVEATAPLRLAPRGRCPAAARS